MLTPKEIETLAGKIVERIFFCHFNLPTEDSKKKAKDFYVKEATKIIEEYLRTHKNV